MNRVARIVLSLVMVGILVSACQTAPPVVPTPRPPATPLPAQPPTPLANGETATPMPAVQPPGPPSPPPTPRPLPTPITLAGYDWTSVAYREFWPLDLSGEWIAGFGSGGGMDIRTGGILLVNVRTGVEKQVTSGGERLIDVVISGDYIAWADRSRQIEIPRSTARDSAGRLAVDIFVKDLSTGEQRRITEVPARRRGLSIDGHRLVWQDNRNEIGEDSNHYDIYAYDMKADEEIAVAVAPGEQEYPVISGDRVVWNDNSGDTSRLMLYDFTDKDTKVIDDTTEPELPPDIHGDCVVWRGHDENGNHGVYLYDLESGQRRLIASSRLSGLDSPIVSDSYCGVDRGMAVRWVREHNAGGHGRLCL